MTPKGLQKESCLAGWFKMIQKQQNGKEIGN